MKARHKGAVTFAVVALLALGGAGTAAAEDRPSGDRPAADRPSGDRPGARGQERCDRLAGWIGKLQRVKTNLENRIARVEAKIASGELSQEEMARARALLGKLQNRLEQVEAKLARLRQLFGEKCSPGGAAPPASAVATPAH